MNELMKRALLLRFERVPTQTVVMWDWHSAEGRSFMEAVDAAVQAGVDINEVGSLIGMRNFSQRYRILKRGTSASANADDLCEQGQDDRHGGHGAVVPEVWDTTATEGQEAAD